MNQTPRPTRDAYQLLDLIEAASPIANMNPDFKGAHSLTLTRDGELQVLVWHDQNRASRFVLNTPATLEMTNEAFVASIAPRLKETQCPTPLNA